MELFKNKKLYLITSIVLCIILCMSFVPMSFAKASENTDMRNSRLYVSFLSQDRNIVVGDTTTFGVSFNYFDETINHTATLQWYTNSTYSYTGATEFSSSQSIVYDKDVGFTVANLNKMSVSLSTLDPGIYYLFATISEGGETLNTFIRKVTVVATESEIPETNDITIEYWTNLGIIGTTSAKVGDKFKLITAADTDTLIFSAWTLNNKAVTADTIITSDMYTVDELTSKKTIKLHALYKDLSDSDTRYLVSYHKFTDKFLFFDKDEVLTTRTVYLNQGVPDISSELASNFSYLSFDKKGLNAVPEDYKVTKDISLYVNYKTDVNVKTYVVTYMDCKNSVAFTQVDFDLLNTRVVNENSKYDLTVDTADLQSGTSVLYFVGWSFDKNGKHMVTENDVVTGDVTLYAQYSVDNVAPKSNNGIFQKAANYFDELYQNGGIPVGLSAVLAWLTVILSFVLIIYIVFMLIRKLLIR